jgi:hypothetical protein
MQQRRDQPDRKLQISIAVVVVLAIYWIIQLKSAKEVDDGLSRTEQGMIIDPVEPK